MLSPAKVGWVDHPSFDAHSTGEDHPEHAARLWAIREALAAKDLDRRLLPGDAPEIDRELLERIHDPSYVRRLELLCQRGGGYLDGDTNVIGPSFEAACRAAGGVVEAVEKVLAGTWDRAFCSVRPPGHHARPQTAMGFCLFDNVALAAQAALDRGLERVAILDWDVHHGNGTQEIFYDRADVFFVSWHQYPFYPGTGSANETGVGPGEGATLNVPLARGATDLELLRSWDEVVRPRLEEFNPELILISAGFDGDHRDPLAGLELTPGGFESLSSKVVDFAKVQAQGRVVSVLEGGYHRQALGEGVVAHLQPYF